MATQAIRKQETELAHAPAYSGSLTQLLEFIDREELVENNKLGVSTGKALGGAKSVLVALGLEGGVVMAVFFVWQIVRSMR
ncbi:MAG: hypothetical protein KGJ51_03860 [Acidobacteriota bacterium]|nr:hypothetical protein [Acidobacteriota bacterium]